MTELTTGSDLTPNARKEGDAVVVAVRGDIDLHQSPKLRGDLLLLIANHQPKKLILNLSEVKYMDSSAVAVLVESMQKLRPGGGKVYLTNLQPRVKSLLEIAKLGSIFTITANEADALAK